MGAVPFVSTDRLKAPIRLSANDLTSRNEFIDPGPRRLIEPWPNHNPFRGKSAKLSWDPAAANGTPVSYGGISIDSEIQVH
jgi:hypothetical protein